MDEVKKRPTINGETQAARNRRLGLTGARAHMSPEERRRHNDAASRWTRGETRHVGRTPTLDEIERRQR